MTIEIIPLSCGIGAEIRGTALNLEMPLPTLQKTLDAFATYRLLLFRDQSLTPEQHVAFSQRFGALENFIDFKDQYAGIPELLRVSNIDQETDQIKDVDEPGHKSFTIGTSAWHADSSYKEVPSRASLLYSIEVPDGGGETEFADTAAAYTELPEGQKREFEDLIIIHDFEETRRRNGLPPRSLEVRLAAPAVAHPLVLDLPDCGKCLFLGQHASYVIGKSYLESREFLDSMVDYTTQPQFVYRHEWRVGDLVVFDNLAMLHRLCPYDLAHCRRLLHRTTVAGGPIAARVN